MMPARTATAVTAITAVESTEQLLSSSERYISSAELKELSSEEIAGLLEIESSESTLPSPSVDAGESLEIYISREGLLKLSSAELKGLLK